MNSTDLSKSCLSCAGSMKLASRTPKYVPVNLKTWEFWSKDMQYKSIHYSKYILLRVMYTLLCRENATAKKNKNIPTTQRPFDEPSATTFQKGCRLTKG